MQRISPTSTILPACLLVGLLTATTIAAENQPNADFWSLRPLPPLSQIAAGLDNASPRMIDQLIARKLRQRGLEPGRRATPHRQLRRLSLMLTGLPPTAERAAAFVADPSEAHYQRLVEHYLHSPAFGERFARHWMDVVRYAETWGYEWNHLVREAWRYRDYLIRAFNQDVPYDQLIREHIAGDLLENPRLNHALGINESLIGTAFYRFGETGHDDCVLYPEISLDVMDNQIDTLSKAFQALTVACSRCHDHKLDDIPQRDYYALLGVMASSRQVIRTLDLPGRQQAATDALRQQKKAIRRALGAIWTKDAASITAERLDELVKTKPESQPQPHAAQFVDPLFAWHRMRTVTEATWHERFQAARRALAAEARRRDTFNQEHFETIADFSAGAQEGWTTEGLATEEGRGFTTPGDFAVLPSGAGAISGLLPAGFYSHTLSDRLNAVLRSPLLPENKKYVSYLALGQNQSVCRTVIANCTLPYFHTHRFNATKPGWTTVDLAHVRKSPLFPLKSFLEWATALDDQGYPVLNMPQTQYQEMLDNPRSHIGVIQVVVHDEKTPPLAGLGAQEELWSHDVVGRDGLAARFRNLVRGAVDRWSREQATAADVFWINAFLELGVLRRERDASAELAKLVRRYRELEEQLETPKRIVGLADQGNGLDVPLLAGGDIHAPADTVHRGFLSLLEDRLPGLPEPRGSGRRRMAEVVAHAENPLTARVMANRLWHYLLGHGIVRSVDNFGALGDRPSHPALLDYLGRRLVDSGWSVKTVIREIVLSDTFRQSSTSTQWGKQKDPENHLFHRYPSRRLEAEAIRDAMLFVAGRLDPTLFGPSVNPYRTEDVDRRKLYAGSLDGEGRRSVYLKVTRMGPAKLLELFNLPDPSVTRGRRDRTNVPAQALGMLNHPFVHQQAGEHAKRLCAGSTEASFGSRLEKLFLGLFGRRPSQAEHEEYWAFFQELAAAQGVSDDRRPQRRVAVWKDLIHLLYNLKEFTYVL